jgi:GNAT superfamily N-acetyltransferase
MATSEIGYTIRLARADELENLQQIERAAGMLFAEIGWQEVAESDLLPLDFLEEQQSAGLIWVTVDMEDKAVGFAVVTELEGTCFLEEISVHPAHGRRGIGKSMIEMLCGWAIENEYPAMTLMTFQDAPWNAPFYSRLGFRVLGGDELSLDLREVLEEETQAWMPLKRVLMRRELGEEK